MARARTLTLIADEAYRYADCVGMTDRHPRADVVRWCNQGLTELYDALVMARGLDWYRTTGTIALVDGTSSYSLPAAFYQLLGVRMNDGGALQPFTQADAAELRDGYVTSGSGPRYYQLGGSSIVFLPTPGTGTITLDYVPAFVDLADNSSDTFDGVNGWEDYASLWAAKRMALKDADETRVALLSGELTAIGMRVRALATRRDAGTPRQVKDVRGQAAHARWRWWR